MNFILILLLAVIGSVTVVSWYIRFQLSRILKVLKQIEDLNDNVEQLGEDL